MIEDKGQLEMITLTKPSELCHHRIKGQRPQKVAAMMSMGMRTFFQSRVQKNPKDVRVHALIK